MKGRFRVRVIDLMIIAAVVLYAGWKGMNRHSASLDAGSSAQATAESLVFAKKAEVDLSPFSQIAVQADGRLRSFESHATTFMGYVTGRRSIDGQSDGFTDLDMMFRPEVYEKADIIYIKKKPVRARITAALSIADVIDAVRAKRILESGLISKPLLRHPVTAALLDKLGMDLIRTAKDVNAIESALAVSDPRFLEGQLRVVAPPDGSANSPWIGLSDLLGASGAPSDHAHAGVMEPKPIPGLDPAVQRAVAQRWPALREAWRAGDVPAVNSLIRELAGIFPSASSALYPDSGRLSIANSCRTGRRRT
jgi:hypothetical protein